MKISHFVMAVFAAVVVSSVQARAETTECTEITTLPATITVQGIYCFKQNLVTAVTSGNAIDIQTNNVTIDMNGYKLGGNAAGVGTSAAGIFADGRKNITIRNGNIRGFFNGIHFSGSNNSGHIIEDMKLDKNTKYGISISGNNHIIRNNQVINTGPSSGSLSAAAIRVFSANNIVIENNLMAEVTETNSAIGIYIDDSSVVEIRGNSILNITGASSNSGIYATGTGSTISVINNRILNPAPSNSGTYSIFGNATVSGVDCIDNTIKNFSATLYTCDYTSGNHKN